MMTSRGELVTAASKQREAKGGGLWLAALEGGDRHDRESMTPLFLRLKALVAREGGGMRLTAEEVEVAGHRRATQGGREGAARGGGNMASWETAMLASGGEVGRRTQRHTGKQNFVLFKLY